MMVVITMMVLLINMVMIVMVCVPASPFVALGGFSYTKQKNQTKSKGTHVYGNELFAWSSVFLFLIAELKPSHDTSAVTIY